MLPKVAVVLFVKNEYPDICNWLAWYFAIGVDTIIVHDDHSTDGTWEVALAASRCLDVRPIRTDLSVQPFTARQRDAYLGAIRLFRDEFDWIGLLDADEYLYLREERHLPSFLAGFPDAGAIAFSWCIYGSNGHLLKPAASTVEAFTRHSLPEFGHNRSVKSFVRPKLVIDRWRDPHTFDVGDAPYVDARGNPVRWGGPGAIGHDPDWSIAKLMHFIPRSMEHFVERIRRRSDLRGLTNEYWNVFNMNDVEDREPLQILQRTRPFLFMIDDEIMKDYVTAVTGSDPRANDVLPVQPDGGEYISISHVVTCFGTILALDDDGQLVHLAPADLPRHGCTPVICVSRSGASEAAILFAPGRIGPLNIRNDPHLSALRPFHLRTDPEGAAITLRSPRTLRYLTAMPPGVSGIGQTSGDRSEAKGWETFELLQVDEPDGLPATRSLLSALVEKPVSVETIAALARAGATPAVCAAGVQLLPAAERTELHRRVPNILPSWAS